MGFRSNLHLFVMLFCCSCARSSGVEEFKAGADDTSNPEASAGGARSPDSSAGGSRLRDPSPSGSSTPDASAVGAAPTAVSSDGGPFAAPSSEPPAPEARSIVFERQVISRQFVAEGATFGDFNHDGTTDIVAGSYWYEGPAYDVPHPFRTPAVFDPLRYSDNFFAFDHDFNGDGWDDVLVVGFPGESAGWYENPLGAETLWTRHEVFAQVDNESPAFVDLTGDGARELVCNSNGFFGWAGPDGRSQTDPFSFQPLSEPGSFTRFTHGLGVGDVNGDGRADVLASGGVWLQPNTPALAPPWAFEAHDFGFGGAQMFAYDVDGDGDQDVITTLQAHGYGVAWFEQYQEGGERKFRQHIISGGPDAPGPTGIVLHEPHALALVDVDGDSLLDIVTGERFWAHVPKPAIPDAPAQIVWFRLLRVGTEVSYEPHVIDSDSGVGTQVVARAVDGREVPSIVVANKKGVFVFRGSHE